jgi:hypothetical protein
MREAAHEKREIVVAVFFSEETQDVSDYRLQTCTQLKTSNKEKNNEQLEFSFTRIV